MDLNLVYYQKGSNKLNSLEFKNITYLEAYKEIDKFLIEHEADIFKNKERQAIIEVFEDNKKQMIYMQFAPYSKNDGNTSIGIVLKLPFFGLFGGTHAKFTNTESLSSFKIRLQEIDIKNIEYLYNKYSEITEPKG